MSKAHPCTHARVAGDRSGETCLDCHEKLAGFGFNSGGAGECSHRFEADPSGDTRLETCCFCRKKRPAMPGESTPKRAFSMKANLLVQGKPAFILFYKTA